MLARRVSFGRVLLIFAACLVAASGLMLAQGFGGQPQQPPPLNMSEDPMLQGFRFRPIGPAVMGGRIDDIEAVETDPTIVYVGYARSARTSSTRISCSPARSTASTSHSTAAVCGSGFRTACRTCAWTTS
jgi:hypothetical protein